MRIDVSFGARGLAGANDGLDLEACAARYAAALEATIARRWPSARVEVAWGLGRDALAARCTLDADEGPTARGIERDVLDLAWVVRQMVPWG